MCQPFEGENLQSGIAGKRRISQQLPLQLISSLLRREQDQCRSVRRGRERLTNFRQATEGLAAPRWPQKQMHLHALSSRKGVQAQRNLFASWIPRANGLLSPALSSTRLRRTSARQGGGGEGEDTSATWEDYDHDYDYDYGALGEAVRRRG